MKKALRVALSALTLALLTVGSLIAQSPDPVILSYQRNFIRASISTKIELLGDATRITTIDMVPLFADALDFVHEYHPILGNDSQLIDLAVTAASRCVQWQDASILPKIMVLFNDFPDSRVRSACLDAFSALATADSTELTALNAWFAGQITQYRTGTQGADAATLIACAKTLGKIASVSSFDVLFQAATSDIDSGLSLAGKNALNEISVGYTDRILAIFATGTIQLSYDAYRFSRDRTDLSAEDRGKTAQTAFGLALSSSFAGTDAEIARKLLDESLDAITELAWSPSSPDVVKYFYQVQGDYKNGKADYAAFLPVIRAMGAMGTTESAQALSIFLGLLNSETEQKKTYNEQLMLAVIQSLGDLGDKTAFDYLLYVGYLDYPETVKKASRDALARLQW